MSQAQVLGKLVPTAFDGSFSSSRISQTLATALNMVGENVSLPINADMGSGSFTCVVNLEVDNELHSDVVLGSAGEFLVFLSLSRVFNFCM